MATVIETRPSYTVMELHIAHYEAMVGELRRKLATLPVSSRAGIRRQYVAAEIILDRLITLDWLQKHQE